MKIFCSEISKTGETTRAKSVVIQKKGNSYVLLKHYTTDAENIQHLSKDMDINIGVDYYDYIDESVTLPPVKDYKTFKILATNKLKESIESDTDYIMAYKENTQVPPEPSGTKTYKVFMTPSSLFNDFNLLSKEQKNNVNMFTISDFALSALIKKYYPGKLIFHAYADGTKICVTVCYEDVVLYTRSNSINSDIKDHINSYYEYLNLTFMFITKNMRLNPDNVIFSGDLADLPELSSMFFEFSKVPQATIFPGHIIQNCSYKLLQEYMIPISLFFLDEAYDFTPQEVKHTQAKNTLTMFSNIAAMLILLVLLCVTALSAFDLISAKSDLEINAAQLKSRISQYGQVIRNSSEKKYDLFYYSAMKSSTKSPVRLIPDFMPLLNKVPFETVSFDKDINGANCLILNGKIDFSSLSQAEYIKNAINEFIADEKTTSKYEIDDKSAYNMESMSASINITFKPKAGGAS